MLVTITKISDDRYKGNHPNNITEGYTFTGFPVEKKPIVGHRFIVNTISRYFNTSLVTEIIDKNTFKTKNSTYSLKYKKNKK